MNHNWRKENSLAFLVTSLSFNYLTMVSLADKSRFEDFDISSHRRRISVAEDILRSPDDDSISVASAFSQRSDCEDDAEVSGRVNHVRIAVEV